MIFGIKFTLTKKYQRNRNGKREKRRIISKTAFLDYLRGALGHAGFAGRQRTPERIEKSQNQVRALFEQAKAVAQKWGVDESTVRTIFREHMVDPDTGKLLQEVNIWTLGRLITKRRDEIKERMKNS